MQEHRPYTVSIAGLDPSAGAGLLADIKVFEQHRVYGFGICSALTVQHHKAFLNVDWLSGKRIIKQLEPIFANFIISAIKIGIVKDLETLLEVILYIRQKFPHAAIVWDPVVKASAGFHFHGEFDTGLLDAVLREVTLVTPNQDELILLQKYAPEMTAYDELSMLLKGGHSSEKKGVDKLISKGEIQEIYPVYPEVFPKHGSGCVLSSSIVSNLALGHDLYQSCRRAKVYTEQFLKSNLSLLGYHNHD